MISITISIIAAVLILGTIAVIIGALAGNRECYYGLVVAATLTTIGAVLCIPVGLVLLTAVAQ